MSVRRVLPSALAYLLILLVVAALVARARRITSIPALLLAVGSPYFVLAAVVAVVLGLMWRRVLLSIVAVAVLTASFGIQVSWYYFGDSPDIGESVGIRVLSSNLRKGQADPAFVTALAREGADVITVAELTPEAVEGFARAGINDIFRYSHLMPAPAAGGLGIWSRFPLTPLSIPRHRLIKIPAVRLEVPDVRFDPVLASVHVYSPVAGERDTVSGWQTGMTGAKVALQKLARIAGRGAVIVGGDYNSTPDMRQFRDLLTKRYRDAVEQTGSGFAPTYPSNAWYPPLITIDHVLTRNAAASSVRTITVPGSDHRALLTTVQVPMDPTAS